MYIGIMSGTSLDGIDCVLVDFLDDKIKIIDFISMKYPIKIKEYIIDLQKNNYHTSLLTLGENNHYLGIVYADIVNEIISKNDIDKSKISAIGCHGQTIFHSPSSDYPFSLQIGDGNAIACLTGIDTVVDFRNSDMIFGGQGAPLVPAFHENYFYSNIENRVILNLGGIANITYLSKNSNDKIVGFDTGPANTLLDCWIKKNIGSNYDKNGAWAEKGNVLPNLLSAMLEDKYFKKSYPKSTGTEYFNLDWIENFIVNKNYRNVDIQATLLYLTVETIALNIELFNANSVYICGGGSENIFLINTLKKRLSAVKFYKTDALGLDTQKVEAVCFAWLAMRRIKNLTANLPDVTSASKTTTLGAVYSA